MSQIQRTKAIEFNCPTLISTSYNQQGKQSGGSLAQVPITKKRGEVEVWQAAYDNSVPIDLRRRDRLAHVQLDQPRRRPRQSPGY